jgi:hypothetical protein
MRDIIVAASDADFENHTYTMVYSSSNATPTINGTEVSLVAGVTIEMLVKSISSTNNIYLIGGKKIITPTII